MTGDSEVGRSLPGLLRPLRHSEFRKLWIGQVFSAIGNGITPVALTILVLDSGRPSSHLGLVLGAQSAGLILFVLVGGVVADRVVRTRVMAASDVLRAMAVFGLAAIGSVAGLPVLMVLTFVLGVGMALFDPAQRSLLPSLIPDHDLQAANALSSVTARTSLIIGPPVGGLVAAAYEPAIIFIVDGITFVVSVVALLSIRPPRRRPTPGQADEAARSPLVQAWDGVRAVRRLPWAGAVILQGAVQVLMVHAPLMVLVPLVLQRSNQLPAYGFVLAVQAVGALIGAAVVSRWEPSEPGTIALLGMLAGLPLIICLLAGAPLPAIVATAAATGAGGSVFAVLWASAIQRRVPNDILGRVVSLDYVGQLGLEPVGLAFTAPVVALLGLSPAIAICGIALLATTGLPFLVPGVRRFGGPAPSQLK